MISTSNKPVPQSNLLQRRSFGTETQGDIEGSWSSHARTRSQSPQIILLSRYSLSPSVPTHPRLPVIRHTGCGRPFSPPTLFFQSQAHPAFQCQCRPSTLIDNLFASRPSYLDSHLTSPTLLKPLTTSSILADPSTQEFIIIKNSCTQATLRKPTPSQSDQALATYNPYVVLPLPPPDLLLLLKTRRTNPPLPSHAACEDIRQYPCGTMPKTISANRWCTTKRIVFLSLALRSPI
ncbi:hypothetical protein R3P38DRAFT_3605548 [Favolaschia claudopus]|uniref:Uncharacterized protein n=1 Tax=Favolaschia claudopus TaxID=2862362 RepID=A0AAW0A8D8_9AGAR